MSTRLVCHFNHYFHFSFEETFNVMSNIFHFNDLIKTNIRKQNDNLTDTMDKYSEIKSELIRLLCNVPLMLIDLKYLPAWVP